ncbi:unnamed protein product, partial [marine sediment metagenome]
MKKKRRPWAHQVDAMNYCRQEKHPALFMDMRLGKNLVTIRRIKMYKPLDADQGLRVLIVPPGSAIESWEEDLDLEGETDVSLIMASTRKKRKQLLMDGHKWNIINKEGFLAVPEIGGREHCELCGGSGKNPETKKSCGRCHGLGSIGMGELPVNWDAAVLDESTSIKNPKAKITKFFLRTFRDCPHRWILAGMPNPEGPLEFWSQ